MTASSSHGEGGAVLSGIGFSFAAYAVFALHDATIKWLVADFSAWQILFMRSAVILPVCFLFGGRRTLLEAIESPVRRTLALRALVLLAAWLSYYTAARYLQLAEMTTIYFSSPLMVAALAMPLLGERVSRLRWLAIAIGFAGIVIACRPADLQQPGPIGLALMAAGLWAYAMILFRQIAPKVRTLVQMLISNSAYLVLCGAAMPWAWRAPSLSQFALMILVGLFGAAAQFLATEGIRRAPATVVAPLEFTALLWSFCLGFVIWGDLPDAAVFIGAGLILTGGLLVIGAEWQAVRRRMLLSK